MKTKLLLPALSAVILLAACSETNKQTSAEAALNDSNTIVLNDSLTTVTWIKDNQGDKTMGLDLFPDAPDSLIKELSLESGIPASISTFLMHADGEWLLFDTGLGAERGGQMLEGLNKFGLTPDSIKYIFLTHFHADHIGGLVQDGKPVFPNTQVLANHSEYMTWMLERPIEQSDFQRTVMDIYKDHLKLFAWGDTLPHGIVAMYAPGHTPGHTAFLKDNMIIIGDLMHGVALQLNHPEYSCNFDMNKAEAAQSRIRITESAQQFHYIMAGMHLPEPGFIQPDQYKADSTGYIVRVGQMAPDFTCKQDDGQEIRLSDLRGKVVMLQFTASWCGVCRQEMPFIERDIWQKHKNDDFYLIGIDRDEPLATVRKVREQTGITYPLGLDPSAEIYVKYALRHSGITRNVLIDREGRIVKLTRLYNEEEFASLVEMIDQMLAAN